MGVIANGLGFTNIKNVFSFRFRLFTLLLLYPLQLLLNHLHSQNFLLLVFIEILLVALLFWQ